MSVEKVTMLGGGQMGGGASRLLTSDRPRVSHYVDDRLRLTQIVVRPLKGAKIIAENLPARADYLASSETWPTSDVPIYADGDSLVIGKERVRFILADVKGDEPIEGFDCESKILIEATGALNYKREFDSLSSRLKASPDTTYLATHNIGNDGVKTLIVGVNEIDYDPKKDRVISNGSCTTKCAATVLKPMLDKLGLPGYVEFFGVHGTTSSQKLEGEASVGDARKSRSAHTILKTRSGASDGLSNVFPNLNVASMSVFRVFERDDSVLEMHLHFPNSRDITEERVNKLLEAHSQRYPQVISCVDRKNFVSSDVAFMTQAAVVDMLDTKVVHIGDKTIVAVTAYYPHARGSQAQVLYLADHVLKSK